MLLRWTRADDGVITVHARTSDGRAADIADFWLRPMIEKLGAAPEVAERWQEEFAAMLVETHNKLFSEAGGFGYAGAAQTLDRRHLEEPGNSAHSKDTT